MRAKDLKQWGWDCKCGSGLPIPVIPATEVEGKVNRLNSVIEAKDDVLKELRDENKRLKDLLTDLRGWLKRMSELKWDDPEYAPNFKKSVSRIDKELDGESTGIPVQDI